MDGHQLPDDHPGASDPTYRRRRSEIAEVSGSWVPGEPLPDIDYTDTEHDVWRTVASHLRPLHDELTSEAFRSGRDALDLPTDRIPQLGDVSARLQACSGFRLQPVPGLVPTRMFYGALADGVFLSTQYVRHPSVPLYTPEPDVIHEIVGHGNLLAHPVMGRLHRLAGEASLRCETDEALEFFSRVFWFTLEFGVVRESAELLAYGAGLASSYGELGVFRQAEIRPYDELVMGTTSYDITNYQPVLFAIDSIGELDQRLGDFFATFDDEAHARMVTEAA